MSEKAIISVMNYSNELIKSINEIHMNQVWNRKKIQFLLKKKELCVYCSCFWTGLWLFFREIDTEGISDF